MHFPSSHLSLYCSLSSKLRANHCIMAFRTLYFRSYSKCHEANTSPGFPSAPHNLHHTIRVIKTDPPNNSVITHS